MISGNFIYTRPDTIEEAVRAYVQSDSEGRKPFYYGGGTEIVTFARNGRIRPGAIIDIKKISECRQMGVDGAEVVFGAGLTLNRIVSSGLFPLLAEVAGRVADHTVRNRLTLGGNIAGQLPYRETVLPFLLADAQLLLVGPSGRRTVSANETFSRRLQLAPGELLVHIRVPVAATRAVWKHVRRERTCSIDYPLVSISFIRHLDSIRMAVSGLCSFPFRDPAMEMSLNAKNRSPSSRTEDAFRNLPAPIRDDQRGSSEYRNHLAKKIMADAVEELERST